ncbi:MAG: DUF4190 domain-containing protein [Verrucomicrobiota bacterium]
MKDEPNPYDPPTPPPPPAIIPVSEPVTRQTSGSAITSMVLGILSIISCPCGIFVAVFGIVFGHLAQSNIRKDPRYLGTGMALTGLILSYLTTVLTIAGLIAFCFIQDPETGQPLWKEIQEEFQDSFEKGLEEGLES